MSSFFGDFRKVHSKSLAFVAALPLIAAIPLVAELVQHVVEMKIGMYAGPEGAEAAATNALRLYFGFAKVVALSLPAYFLVRWLHAEGDKRFATRAERPAMTLFALAVALQALFGWLSLFVWSDGPGGFGFLVFGLIFMPLVARFVVAAPLGTFISPLRSIRTMLPHVLHAVLFPLAAMLPLMGLHYALGIGAIFVTGETMKWAMLFVDSFVTAWLALVVIAAQYVIATRPAPLTVEGMRPVEAPTPVPAQL